MKPKIAIIFPADWWDPSYSLCSVVENQLRSFVKYGYEVTVCTLARFNGEISIKGVVHKKILPLFEYTDYSQTDKLDPHFEEQVQAVQRALEDNLKGYTHLITHDLIFQGWFLVHNVAVRRANLQVKWLHWIHSAPHERKDAAYPFNHFYLLKPNEKLIYLNDIDKIKAAEMFGVFPADVAVVPNAIDPRTFWGLHPFTEHLLDKYDILGADIISVYPLSTPRMISGKQLHKAVRIHEHLKKLYGLKTKYIVCNAHANAQKEKDLVKETQETFMGGGLSPNEVIFTSFEEAPAYEVGVPRQVVKELFQLSNLFLFPSISENCSLILLEAALSGNLLVLNKSFLPMRAQLGDQALYFDFGALGAEVHYDNEAKYYEDVAKIIFAELKSSKPIMSQIKIRQEFNLDITFRRYIEPLFYL